MIAHKSRGGFMSIRIRTMIVVQFVPLFVLLGCSQQPPPAPPTPKAQLEWPKVSQNFIDGYFKGHPFMAAQAGRHEFDGKMPDLSSDGIKGEIARLHDARDVLNAIKPADLTPTQRFEREYLLSVADKDIFWFEKAKFPFKNPAWYVDQIDPDMYFSRNYAPLDARMKAYIAYAHTIPTIAKNIRENLRTPLPKTFVDYGVKGFGGFADFFRKNAPAVFKDVKDADLQKQLADVDTAAAEAMSQLKDWFVTQAKTADDNFALGKDLYTQMLFDSERVDVPVDQIEAAGKADLERNLAALTQACATYAPKASPKACIAKMAGDKPKGASVEAARMQLAGLKDFVQKNAIVAVPTDDQALVAEAPPYNRSNFAFIQIPGPFDRGVASVYNIAPPDPTWSKAEQAAYIPGKSSLLITTAHEVWPGHFLQFLHSNTNASKLEGIWIDSGFAEGWAHYAEEMMIEEGLGKNDPSVHVAQIQAALLRDVRLLSSIGMHTHGMTVAQSEKMFLDQAFEDPGNARQQAARGARDPGYLVYTMGKLMIRKLRSDWVAKQGGGADDMKRWREFHDQFLSYGGPPIPLVRKAMMGDDSKAL
jgi:Bacterial protein of unknown function (DUF885)